LIDITSDVVVAQFGIDPADQSRIAVGQVFDVWPIDDRASGMEGTVSLLAHNVNSTTRLIDATLTPGDALPRPGTPLRLRHSRRIRGIVIPRSALVPESDQMVVFVVRDGTAKRIPGCHRAARR